MPGDSLNPYAPPAQEVAAGEIPGVWRVEGDYLVVREGALLPPVDLDDRGAGGPLTPMLLQLQVPTDGKGMAVHVASSLPVLGYCAYQIQRDGEISMLVVLSVMFGSHFLFKGIKVRTHPAHLFGFVSVPAARALTRRARWRRWLLAASLLPVALLLGLVFAFPFIGLDVEWLFRSVYWGLGALVASLVLVIAVTVWMVFDRGLTCTRFRDGWMWVKGASPRVLANLAARSTGAPPVMVPRRVFTCHWDRMPAADWRQADQGPLEALKIWWIRARAKAPLDLLCFHWSEREWLAPDQADPELLAAWREETAGTPLEGWTLVYAGRSGSPAGCDEVNELVFLSPDGRKAAIPSITRQAIGGKLKESRGLNFRSFTSDGRILATGQRAPAGPAPEGFLFTRAKGSPAEVACVHLQRLAGESLVTLDAAELRRREEREMQLHHDSMEAAGIYGPLEEIELPRY
jgi:hypothetical protein